jgi:hypothetical protein
MAKFRLSCHHLAVETGGWYGVHMDDRKCTLCTTGSVQDELHVLFVCPTLSPLRGNFPVHPTNNRIENVQKLFQVADRTLVLVIGVWCCGRPSPTTMSIRAGPCRWNISNPSSCRLMICRSWTKLSCMISAL